MAIWIRRFDRYETVPGLEEKPEKIQMDTQIYCMRDKAEDILATFKLSHEDSKNFDLTKVILTSILWMAQI